MRARPVSIEQIFIFFLLFFMITSFVLITSFFNTWRRYSWANYIINTHLNFLYLTEHPVPVLGNLILRYNNLYHQMYSQRIRVGKLVINNTVIRDIVWGYYLIEIWLILANRTLVLVCYKSLFFYSAYSRISSIFFSKLRQQVCPR